MLDNLEIWNLSMNLAVKIYNITKSFPIEEKFSLVDQMRRASISIASNIAEGKSRNTVKDFKHFLYLSRGSLNEVFTQIELANRINYINEEDYKELISSINELNAKLNNFIKYLNSK